MPGIDEVAAKRKKALKEGGWCGEATKELRWAILAAVTVAGFIFAATRIARPSNDPSSGPSTWVTPPSRTSGNDPNDPAQLNSWHNIVHDIGSTSSAPVAAPAVLPSTGVDDDDINPMTDEGPTPIPIVTSTSIAPTTAPVATSTPPRIVSATSHAPVGVTAAALTEAPSVSANDVDDTGNDPMQAEGPTPIGPTPIPPTQGAASSLPPTHPTDHGGHSVEPPGPPPIGDRVLWPRGEGAQPPTPNPRLTEAFTEQRVKQFDSNARQRADNVREIAHRFGKYGCDKGEILHNCWVRDDTVLPPGINGARLDTCECQTSMCCNNKGHQYIEDHGKDNVTNWDVTRREFCKRLREKETPPPADWMALINLTALEAGIGLPLPSGSPRGGLPFDPDVVQDHFFKAQAALALYAEGTRPFTTEIHPTPGEAEYLPMIDALSKRFAAALIRGGDFVVAGLGDSTMAGADNCYYDAFLNVLERQMKPLFASAKIAFKTRNCAHNGGFNSAEQMTCAGTMLGMDTADLVILNFPFVHPDNEAVNFELFIRRSLASGVIPNVGGNSRLSTSTTIVPAYARYGVTVGPESYGGYGPNGGQWWPSGGNAGWGRVGDGVCHVELTRSGSAAVHSRNWHPGPQGHQAMADRWAFLYMTAVTQALEMIKTDLAASNDELAPLLAKYRGREDVKASVSTWPVPPIMCEGNCPAVASGYAPFDDLKDESWWHPRPPGCNSLCPLQGMPVGFDLGFPVCLSTLQPVFGKVIWGDWVVNDASQGWKITGTAPYSDNDHWRGGWSAISTWEPLRSQGQCTHMDTEEQVSFGPGEGIVFAIPKRKIVRGVIGACVICGDKELVGSVHPWDAPYVPVVKVQLGPAAPANPVNIAWLDNQTAFDFSAGLRGNIVYAKKPASCFTLAESIHCETTPGLACESGRTTPSVDVLLHVECDELSEGKVQYLWVW